MRFIDISSNNHPGGAAIDMGAAADSGVQGVIIKVTEADYTNPFAKDDYHNTEMAGIACLGLYDFGRQDLDSGAKDAALFLAGVGSLGGLRAGTRAALDIEEHGGVGPQVSPAAGLAAYALDWASVVWPVQSRQDTLLKPLLYSRRSYLTAHGLTGNLQLDAAFDLWMVWDGNPDPPPGWSKVWMWQHLENTSPVAGIQGTVDRSEFDGIAYDWLSRSWAYQTSPLSTISQGQPDLDKGSDVPTILHHCSDLLTTLSADLALARTKFGLVT